MTWLTDAACTGGWWGNQACLGKSRWISEAGVRGPACPCALPSPTSPPVGSPLARQPARVLSPHPPVRPWALPSPASLLQQLLLQPALPHCTAHALLSAQHLCRCPQKPIRQRRCTSPRDRPSPTVGQSQRKSAHPFCLRQTNSRFILQSSSQSPQQNQVPAVRCMG